MEKNIFYLNYKASFISEAGFLIYNYINFLSASKNSSINRQDSWVKTSGNENTLVRIEERLSDFPQYMNFLREVRTESVGIIKEFFDDKNKDIMDLFSIHEKNDKSNLALLTIVFMNLDEDKDDEFSYDSFKKAYDLFFYKLIDIDFFDLNEKDVNSYEKIKNQVKDLDIMAYIAKAKYSDKDMMTLIRAYKNTFDLYQRLLPLVNKLGKIIASKFYLIKEIFDQNLKDFEETSYKRAFEFAKQVGFEDCLNISQEIEISILLLLPFSCTFTFWDSDDMLPFMKFGILMSMYENQDEKNKLTNISNELKIISDQTRIDILDLLNKSDYYAKELSDKLYITPATLSYHINQLHAAGLLRVYKKGRRYYYQLKKSGFDKIIENLREFSKNIKEENHEYDQ